MNELEQARADLRERLVKALTREHYRRARERTEASVEDHCAGFADAVLPVIEEALASQVLHTSTTVVRPGQTLVVRYTRRRLAADEADRLRAKIMERLPGVLVVFFGPEIEPLMVYQPDPPPRMPSCPICGAPYRCAEHQT